MFMKLQGEYTLKKKICIYSGSLLHLVRHKFTMDVDKVMNTDSEMLTSFPYTSAQCLLSPTEIKLSWHLTRSPELCPRVV